MDRDSNFCDFKLMETGIPAQGGPPSRPHRGLIKGPVRNSVGYRKPAVSDRQSDCLDIETF